MVHGQSILMTTAIMRTQNGRIFNFCGILKTTILHNFVNAIVGIEQTFQHVFKSSIEPIFYITNAQTGPGFHICDDFFLFILQHNILCGFKQFCVSDFSSCHKMHVPFISLPKQIINQANSSGYVVPLPYFLNNEEV